MPSGRDRARGAPARSAALWYNGEHRHSGIRYVTPDERHRGLDHDVLANRARVYDLARRKNPARWACRTRNWTPVGAAFLNRRRNEESLAAAEARARHADRASS